MRLVAIAAVALFALYPAAAFGESFASQQYGFSADFPSAPTVGEPQKSETDAKGKTIANSVMIQDAAPGAYTAMVTVESYTAAVAMDAPSTLQAMAKGFAAQLDAKLISNKAGKVDGKPARFFSYDNADHSTAGSGIVIVVPGKKPRVYLVVSMHTPAATPEQLAALETFVKSFKLQ